MSDNHDNHRTQEFDKAYSAQPVSPKSVLSYPAAQALVDQALWHLGIDPQEAIDEDGWRHIALGTAQGRLNVIEWEPELYYLVVWSPILRVPDDMRLRAELFETLLLLNHHETGMARFSLKDGLIVLAAARPIQGLDLEQVLDMIRMVMVTADHLDEPLQQAFAITMPHIEVNAATAAGILNVLRLCDGHTQTIFDRLMEGWVAQKGIVQTGDSAIQLRSRTDKQKTLAGLVGYAAEGPLVVIGWNSLAKTWGVPAQDITMFQQLVPRPKRFKLTASSAHLPVDESFTAEMADALLMALAQLDAALEHAVPPQQPTPPDLKEKWGLEIMVGGATQQNIDAVLTTCSAAAQASFIHLLQGWHNIQQKIYTNNPKLIYLRLTVDKHTFALCTLRGADKKQAARIELFYPLTYYFERYPEPRRRYEQAVAKLPGFTVHNSGATIVMNDSFTLKNTEQLFKALQRLVTDVQ
ncbi:MAG TPA: YbjN domain-containing protein [Anaerolineae bacterium]|nr:YbjN domain-containing protein [Anaerolineae bacterium]HQI87449.1 YbjN domain-containing protein [Anaerolineae bacterium]